MGWDKIVYVEVATRLCLQHAENTLALLVSYRLFTTLPTFSVHQGSPRTLLKG